MIRIQCMNHLRILDRSASEIKPSATKEGDFNHDRTYGIGGNKVYLGEKRNPRFLQVRSLLRGVPQESRHRSIHDLIYFDLLHRLNIYRPDLIPSDLPISCFPSHHILAVLIPRWQARRPGRKPPRRRPSQSTRRLHRPPGERRNHGRRRSAGVNPGGGRL